MTNAAPSGQSMQRRTLVIVLLGAIWAVAVAFALVSLSRAGALPEGPDEWTYDWRTLFFSPQTDQPRNDIAIIVINEDSMAEYDYISPVDRGLVATLLRALDSAGPKAIGLDFIYDRHSEEAKTQQLIEAMRDVDAPLVVGAIDARGRGFDQENIEYQENFIRRMGRDAGHVYLGREDQRLKIGDQVIRYMGERSPEPPYRESFAQVLAEKTHGVPKPPATRYISWQLPPENGDLFPLFNVPRHQPGSDPDVILPESWRPALRDKIVLIGGDFVNRDKHLTPLSVADHSKMPGVKIHAQILAQLIDGRSLQTISRMQEIILLTMVGFLGFLFNRRIRSTRYEWAFYFGGIGGLVIMGLVLFSAFSIIAPSTTLFFAWTLGVTGGHYASRLLAGADQAGYGRDEQKTT